MYDDATLWKLLDRELPAEEAERIETAAKDDAALRVRLEHLRALKQGVLDGSPAPSPDFADRVARAAEGLTPLRLVPEQPRSQTWLKVAAVILAVIGIANLVVELSDPSPVQAQPETAPSDHRVEDYERFLKDHPLDAGQKRQLRGILETLDRQRRQIRQLSPDQLRRIQEAEAKSQERIDDLLSKNQSDEIARERGKLLLEIYNKLDSPEKKKLFVMRLSTVDRKRFRAAQSK